MTSERWRGEGRMGKQGNELASVNSSFASSLGQAGKSQASTQLHNTSTSSSSFVRGLASSSSFSDLSERRMVRQWKQTLI